MLGTRLMMDFLHDLRYAVRTLGRTPGFTAVIVLTLGLGIGANTAIFSLMDQVLLRLLPVRAPEELVQLDGPGPFSGRTSRYGRSETEGSRLRPQGSRRLSPP